MGRKVEPTLVTTSAAGSGLISRWLRQLRGLAHYPAGRRTSFWTSHAAFEVSQELVRGFWQQLFETPRQKQNNAILNGVKQRNIYTG